MSAFTLLLAALSFLAPKDGAVVPTQGAVQKTYFAGIRSERHLRMDNATDREKFVSTGAWQVPLRLAWSGPTNAVYILSVDYAAGGAFQQFVVTNRTAVYITNLDVAQKYVAQITDAQGAVAKVAFVTEDAAPRFLRAEGLSNFRDLGGWKTSDGHRVRQNRIFRSAGLRSSSKSEGGLFTARVQIGEQRIKPAGLDTLRNEFRIKTDLELRTQQETAGMDDTLLGKGVQWRKVSFAAYDFIANEIRGREPFVKIFRMLANEANYPVLMHCSGGRDRTGTLAFLLNGILGVSEEDLCRDWEASIFADPGMGFSSDRVQRLLDYLNHQPGATLQDRIVSYAISSGVTREQIEAFKKIMLEK